MLLPEEPVSFIFATRILLMTKTLLSHNCLSTSFHLASSFSLFFSNKVRAQFARHRACVALLQSLLSLRTKTTLAAAHARGEPNHKFGEKMMKP